MTPEQEDKLTMESGRGADAERVLHSYIMREAFEMVEQGITDQWKKSPIRDAEGQQYLRLMMKALTDVRKYIEDVAATGKMAAIELGRERTLRARLNSAVHELRRSA